MLDLRIDGGTIIDGSGEPGVVGDIGVRDGKIVAMGHIEGRAHKTIDATGRAVAPGFVDVHTHYDAQILWDRTLSISPWHGVTTVVIGNCGFGVAPTRAEHRDLILRTLEKVEGMSLDALRLGVGKDWPFESFPAYLDAIEARGMAINVGALVGHTPVRTWVMGPDAVRRAATPAEIDDMSALVRDAVEAGALGFATSHSITHNGYDGHPVPSRLAGLDEIDALAGAMAAAGGGLMQATIGKTLFFDQFAALAKSHDIRITWTALLTGIAEPGAHRRMLERTRALIEDDGLAIVPQVSCRPLNFDFDFAEPFPFESAKLFVPTMKTDRAGKKEIYRDGAFRDDFKAAFADGVGLAGWTGRTVISNAPQDRSLEERPLEDAAAERGVDPVDLALDLSLESDFAARFRMAVLNYHEDEVAELLVDPRVVVALSDAGAHASQLCDACYSSYLLGHWVRETGLLRLERAVEMLTRIPAELFGIIDRGLLAEGRAADIVVFDPATIAAGPLRRVHDLPGGADRLVADAVGIDAVIVNGTPIRRGGTDVKAKNGQAPGRLLRHGRAG